jgi:hypothetical protein
MDFLLPINGRGLILTANSMNFERGSLYSLFANRSSLYFKQKSLPSVNLLMSIQIFLYLINFFVYHLLTLILGLPETSQARFYGNRMHVTLVGVAEDR